MATLLRHEREQLHHRRGGKVIDIYFCNVTSIDAEFWHEDFMVMSEAEDGNIYDVEVTTNPPAAPEAATAPPEAADIENQEA